GAKRRSGFARSHCPEGELLVTRARGLAALGRSARFAGLMLAAPSPSWRAVPRHVREIALPTLPPVLAVATFIGMTATLMGYHAFAPLGTQERIGSFAGLITLRELAPLLAGAMIAAKPGTAFTAMLAAMRGSDQIAALESMGVDPVGFLLWPPVVAFAIAAVPLVVFADAAGLLAAYITARVELGVGSASFLTDLVRFVGPSDIGVGLFKGMVFSWLAGGIAAYCGYSARSGPRGVSAAITDAMVTMAVAIVLANAAISGWFYR
ncbi:MAG: ABC transporter permease, partial [Cyanobacteria bacterium REEB65]|nr:ABC transporter permease [Cyanobacteria bacterium REEB65]